MINAMDDGFGFHAIIDPDRDPIEAFSAALDFIAEAGTQSPSPKQPTNLEDP